MSAANEGVRRALTPAASQALARDADAVAAFEEAVVPLYGNLVRRLILVLGDVEEARDTAQDAYLQAWRAWERFDGADARAWLYTIAMRLAFNRLRRRRRWLRALQRIELHPWADPVDPDLLGALQSLDPRARTALLLHVLDGYTQAEIAGMLGVPAGTVASWLSRSRASLRGVLSPDPWSPKRR